MFKETDLGFEYETSQYLVFFGKGEATLEKIQLAYPQFKFVQVKQTHSDRTVEASETTVEADAHHTKHKKWALLIKTADCIPAMIYNKDTQEILAVHAGWRGVENQITYKALKDLNSTQHNLDVFVGPSILQNSFEVDEDVKDALLKSAFYRGENLSYQKGSKYYVDLISILESQISAITPNINFQHLNKDTKTEQNYNSYRRDKTLKRNFSFIVLK